MLPEFGLRNPEINERSVDFPAPDGPIKATLDSLGILKSALSLNSPTEYSTDLSDSIFTTSLIKDPK